MRVDEVQPGVVPQCPSSRGLTCSSVERLAQQRVVEQVDLPDREVVGRAPVGVDTAKMVRREWLGWFAHGLAVIGRMDKAACARTISSSVEMTRTLTRLVSCEIIGAWAAFRSASRRTPRNSSPSQMRSRTGAACSPNAAGEDQRIEPAQRRGKRADPFARLITEQRHRLGRACVFRFASKQVAHVGAGFREPRRPDS